MGSRKVHPDSFKRLAREADKKLAKGLLEQGVPKAEIARRLSVSVSTIYTWFPKAKRGSKAKQDMAHASRAEVVGILSDTIRQAHKLRDLKTVILAANALGDFEGYKKPTVSLTEHHHFHKALNSTESLEKRRNELESRLQNALNPPRPKLADTTRTRRKNGESSTRSDSDSAEGFSDPVAGLLPHQRLQNGSKGGE